MRDHPTTQATEERRTVSFTLPVPLIKAVALYEVESGAKSRSHAAEDLIERGLAVARLEREAVPS